MNRKKHHFYALFIILAGPLDAECGSSDQVVSPTPVWVLTMSDEFDGAEGTPPDPAMWTYDVGGDGWGNQQLEFNTDRIENVSLDGEGHLRIRAIEESYEGNEYTSGRITTQGLFAQKYGRFEARIELPEGAGLWPAFWMLGANIEEAPWPECGEIDILEYVGQRPQEMFGSLHGPGYSAGESLSLTFRLPDDGTFNATMDEANDGEWSGNLVVPIAGTSRLIKQANIGIETVEPNSEVTLSFALRGELTGESGAVFAELLSEVDGGGVSKMELLGGSALFPTDEWVTHSFIVTTGDDVSGGITLQLRAECGAVERCGINAYFDDVTITTKDVDTNEDVELATNGGFETGNTNGWTRGTFADGFHIFAIEWDPSRITFLVDGEVYNIIRSPQVTWRGDWVFTNPFFMILNLAVGGTLGGPVGADTEFPAEMLVDYVRIFERLQ
jgi:beta-glucanase (GH16 family)